MSDWRDENKSTTVSGNAYFPIVDGIVHVQISTNQKIVDVNIKVHENLMIAPCVKSASGKDVPVNFQNQKFVAKTIFKEIKGHDERSELRRLERQATVALLYWIQKNIEDGIGEGFISHPRFGTWYLEWRGEKSNKSSEQLEFDF